MFTIVLVFVGVIGGDYSKLLLDMLDLSALVVNVSASWVIFVVDLRPNPALWKPPTPFFS
jgi:hypothetical protein